MIESLKFTPIRVADFHPSITEGCNRQYHGRRTRSFQVPVE
jgi:hypothetical protein